MKLESTHRPDPSHHSPTTTGVNAQPVFIERDETNLIHGGSEGRVQSNYASSSENQQLIPSSSLEDVDATTESLTSLVEVKPQPFARDQPGRQSMSEKRHATLDAKNTDTYQKRKKAREERENQQRVEQQQRMWKKSASLESLHLQTGEDAAFAEAEKEALRTAYVRANSVRVSRNRGINESFRAAVDRSYEQRDFPGVSNINQQPQLNRNQGGNPDYVIEDLDAANEENQSSKNNVPPPAVLRRNKGGDNRDKKGNRNSRLLTGLSNMFHIGNKKTNTELTTAPNTEGSSDHLRNKSTSQKLITAPNALPSNSSTVSGGSTSAVVGSSSAGASSSSSLPATTHLPHSQSMHSTMSAYVKSRSGGTLPNNMNEQTSYALKNSVSGDNIMAAHQYRLQRHQLQQYPYYQQSMHMQQAPPMPRRPAPIFDQQKHLRQQLRGGSSLHRVDAHEHTRSHSNPRPPPQDMYDYLPSSMMRPGSRVGIADPLSTASTDYDVIQRLQQQPQSQPYPYSTQRPAPPPPPAMQQHINMIQHHQQHSNFAYPFHPGGSGATAVPANQHFHMRTGSNLSSGSSNNNNPSSSSLMSGVTKSRRPKSNYYEYELYNNNHGNYADVQAPIHFDGNQPMQQQNEYHHLQEMYSLPRNTTTLPSMHKQQSHQQYFHTDYN